MNLSLNTTSAWTGAALDTPFDGFDEAMPMGDEATSDQNPSRSHSRPPLASPKPKLIPSILERSAHKALAPLAFMGLVACGSSWVPIDNDGDGYSIAQGDCWDNPENSPGSGAQAAEIHPGATDAPCDDVDQNCDGADATLTRYDDIDSDGYGDLNFPVETCVQPAGTVTNADDCDDRDAAVNPAAAETCDGADQNCNGIIDEDATDVQEWYADADGDGYGDEKLSGIACEAPTAGDVTNSSDCDDTSADVHPYAEEACNTIDDNCDGEIDEDLPLNSFYTDADADGYGDANAEILDCSEVAPAGTVTDATDCDDADAAVNPDATEVCDDADNNCDGIVDDDATDRTTFYADADGDGYGDGAVLQEACTRPSGTVTNTNDCDDAAADVHPYATEVCNGVDDDCDGDADGDATDRTTWYADADGDTYGNAAVSTLTCDSPLAYVANANDCDDTDDEINPAAIEVCDGADNDCSGDADSDASDRQTWYEDADGDTYGNAAVSTLTCDSPLAYVANTSDCDDTDDEINPAAIEVCDGADNDCSGDADSDASDAQEWHEDADGDGTGDASSTQTACDQPVGFVATATDCDDTNANNYPGAPDVFDGAVNDCDSTATTEGPIDITSGYPRLVGEQAGDWLSYVERLMPYVGDINGNGSGDFLVSASEAERGSLSGAGMVYAVDVDTLAGLSGDNNIGSVAFATWTGDEAGANMGYAMAAAGDTDGDGNSDVIFGAPFASSQRGEAYLFTGGAWLAGAYGPSDATVILSGDAEGEVFGKYFTFADFDGDGLDDLVVNSISTSPPERINFFDAGTLASASALTRSDADLILTGSSSTIENLAGLDAQDIDGDGSPDLIVGGTNNNDAGTSAGKIYTVLNPDSLVDQELSTATSMALLGGAAGDILGYLDLINDLSDDGDGLPEIGGGAYLSNNASTDDGSYSVFYSGSTGATGTHTLSDADVTLVGDSAGAGFGRASAVEDLTGDGVDDIFVGTHYDNSATFFDGSLLSAGTYYTNTTDPTFTTFNGSDMAGFSVGLIPASAGTGYALIGSYGYDASTGTDAGSVTVVERR